MSPTTDVLTSNPVYDRLMQDAGWASRVSLPAAHFAAAIASIGLGLFAMNLGAYRSLWVVVALAVPAILFPGLALVSAAVISSAYSGEEDDALLRAGNLSSEKIAWGYIEAVRYRVRLLQPAAFWYPLVPCLSLAGFMVLWSLPLFVVSCFLSLFITQSLVLVGVWVGLRWPDNAILIAGAAAGPLTIAMMLGVAGVLKQGPVWSALIALGLLLLPIALLLLRGVMLKDAIRQIDRRIEP